MNILRKLGAGLCATILSVSLLGVAWSNVGISTIHNRGSVKGWLDKSGFYTKVVNVALEKIKAPAEGKQADNQAGDLPINDPAVQAIAKGVLTPEFLKTNVEKVLDGSYNWLDGSAKNLSFSLDLTNAKQQLATGLGGYATTKAAALKTCVTNELIDDFDAFSSTCRPKGLSAEAVGQKLTDDLLTGDQFLPNPVLTEKDIKIKGSDGSEMPIDGTKQADIVRKSYSFSGYVPYILGIVALLTALGVIFISRDRLKGVRRVGVVLLVNGMLLLLTCVALVQLPSVAEEKLSQNTAVGSVAQNNLISDVAKVIFKNIQNVLVIYTAVFIGLGIIAIVASGLLKKRRDKGKNPTNEGEDQNTDVQPSAEEKPEIKEEPKEVKTPPLVQ